MATQERLDLGDASVQVFVNVAEPYRIAPHTHPHFELLYVVQGIRGVSLEGRTCRARGGDLLVFRPGEVHEEFSASKRISYFVLRFHPAELRTAGVAFPPTDRIGPIISLPSRERFLDLFARMLEEREQPRDGSDLLLGAYLVEFVVRLGRAAEEVWRGKEPEASSAKTRIGAAIEAIQQNLSRDLNLEALARKSFMSVSHFSHVFKETTGESPKRFVIQSRIEKAKQLLAETKRPARDIAQTLGYENTYFFYRQFKQRTGMTTAQWRKRASSGC